MGAVIVDMLPGHRLPGHVLDAPPAVPDAVDLDAPARLRALLFHQRLAALPHHAGAEPRIVKLLDQRGERGPMCVLTGSEERVAQRLLERKILDPLSRPIG